MSGQQHVRRRVAVAALGVLALPLLASCARPDYQYVSQSPGQASAGRVYFKVPQGWQEFPSAQIGTAQSAWSSDRTAKPLLAATVWQSAYDASIQPSLGHVLGTGAADQPTVYASLRTMYAEESGATPAALRELVVPVSSLGRAVTVVSEEPLRQGGAQGLHLVLRLRSAAGTPEQTIDQTAFLSEGNDAVYLLVVRCSTVCYDNHRDEIDSVTSSYTIQEDGSG